MVQERRQTELALTLARLRLCAVAGQIITLFVVTRALHLELPLSGLIAAVAVHATFAGFVWWRLTQSASVGEGEVVFHLGVDIAVLYALLYFTGGAANPFVSLYLLPIALAASALSARYLIAVVLLAGSAYAALMFRAVPLPAFYRHDPDSQFNLHVLGMGVNFAITATLLGYFVWRLARTLRERDVRVRRDRERALRDEGILAIATQAAGAAHELNTPLGTIRTLLGELQRSQRHDAALMRDLDLLASQADRCRDILRELVGVGAAPLQGTSQLTTLGAFVAECADRFTLLRPEVELSVHVDDYSAARAFEPPPGLQHALVALLNNAADASALRQSIEVEFSLGADADADGVAFGIADRGPGLAPPQREAAGRRFFSDKRDGLGIGLALASATAERLGGQFAVQERPGGGARMQLRVPAAALETNRAA